MNAARASAAARITAPLSAVQEGAGPGLVIYAPVYRNGIVPARPAARTAALAGWVCVPFPPRRLRGGGGACGRAGLSCASSTSARRTTRATTFRCSRSDPRTSPAAGSKVCATAWSNRSMAAAGGSNSTRRRCAATMPACSVRRGRSMSACWPRCCCSRWR
ncbi:CHASE domain-containing protein [Luteimonas granuli]